MDGPRELLRRAARSRGGAPAAERAQAANERVRTAGERARPEPHRGSYAALMRSHDRVRARHLPVQGGDGSA